MDEYLAFASALAEASGEVINGYFRKGVDVSYKSDRTPLTIADLEAENLMRQMIQNAYPEHGIIGEEHGHYQPDAEFQWALDPIDGTRSFAAGNVSFGTIIGLMRNNVPLVGAIHISMQGQLLVGDGKQAWLNGAPTSVRDCSAIAEATLLTTSHWDMHKHRDGAAFDALSRRVRLYRTWGDCYGYYLVATGHVDIMVDPAMSIWDLAALVPIIEGAGGEITDYQGKDPLSCEGTVATAGGIHADVIQALNPVNEIN